MAKSKYTFNEKRKEWVAFVYDGTRLPSGQKRRKMLTSKKSSADLEKKVNAFKLSLSEDNTQTRAVTFGEYSKQWLEISKATKELNTQKMYRYTLSYFAGINHKLLGDVTHSDFQQIINEHIEHPRTCRTIKLTFSQIMRAAARDHLIARSALSDVIADVSLPKYQKPLKKPLSASERHALFSADLDAKKRAFVSLLFYCGLRRGEALALTPQDFDWSAPSVSISKSIIYDSNRPVLKPYPKTDNGVRVVPLPAPSVAYIRPYVETCDGFLFHSDGCDMMTAIGYRRMWESIVCAMNVALGYNPQKKTEKPIKKLTAHTFRHNYCTELCYQVPKISTKEIARLLGDNEKMVIDVYSHIIQEKENTAEALAAVFSD